MLSLNMLSLKLSSSIRCSVVVALAIGAVVG
jgi:hypothetical protein